jgi:hypothetical protein
MVEISEVQHPMNLTIKLALYLSCLSYVKVTHQQGTWWELHHFFSDLLIIVE